MLRNSRFWIVVFFVVFITLILVSCGTPRPVQQAEARICATDTAYPIRVADQDCVDGKPGVVWLAGNDSLGPDDYTPVGAPVDDEYLEDDDDSVEHKSHKKTETKKVKPKPTKAAKVTKKPVATKR